jgi:hypothetical protein
MPAGVDVKVADPGPCGDTVIVAVVLTSPTVSIPKFAY